MDNVEKQCPMDCSKCSFRQNVYCASQIGLTVYEMLKEFSARLGAMEGKLETLQADALLIDPTAQLGVEAQTIDSPDKK